jgi:hypothetical protein
VAVGCRGCNVSSSRRRRVDVDDDEKVIGRERWTLKRISHVHPKATRASPPHLAKLLNTSQERERAKMPNNRVKTIKALQSKKTKIATGQVHPNSRRAKQLQRVVLRATKLEHEAKVRRSNEVDRGAYPSFASGYCFDLLAHASSPSLRSRNMVTVDRHLFFVHALPAEATSLSLPELHQLLESYLDRNQPELVDLQHERESRGSWRKSEGKGKREVEIEKTREQEVQEYKAGFGEWWSSSSFSYSTL